MLLSALGAVDVMVPLLCAESGQLPMQAALRQTVPTLLLALSRGLPRRSHREQMLWDVPVAAVTDIAKGRTHRCEPPGQGVLLDGTELQLRTAAGQDVSRRGRRRVRRPND